MRIERGACPGRKRLVGAEILRPGSAVERQLSPDDVLLQKVLRAGRGTPPAFAGAGTAAPELPGRPPLRRPRPGEGFMRGDIADMQVLREAAGRLGSCIATAQRR